MNHLFEYQTKTGDHFPTIFSRVEMYLKGWEPAMENVESRWIRVDPKRRFRRHSRKEMASWMSSFFLRGGKGEVLVRASIFVLAKMILVQPLLARWWFQMFFVFTTYLGKWFILTDMFQMGWFNHQQVSDGVFGCWKSGWHSSITPKKGPNSQRLLWKMHIGH